MNSPASPPPVPGLPPDLAELDAELSGFGAAERPSFAPELESELEAAWKKGPPRSPGRMRRRLAVATISGLLVVGAAVPPARASLAGGFERLLDAFRTPVPAPTQVGTAERAAPVLSEVRQASLDAATVAVPAVSDPLPDPPEVVESPAELPAFAPARVTYPTFIDEDADRRLIRDFYPPELQQGGVGGTVRLLLWVAEDGSVDHPRVQATSGVAALDRAALQGAGTLRFNPATRDGRPVGTYVEFDLVFTPVTEEWVAPRIDPIAMPVLPDVRAWSLADDGPLAIVVPQKLRMEARDLLVLAVGDTEAEIEARLGPLDGVLAGEPPTGASPLRWRSDAIRELERAMTRDPDNPAPVLALARIRRRQGLRAEARALLTRGLERVEHGSRSISPRLMAELNHELGDIVRESWRSQAGLGVIPESTIDDLGCARRDPSGSNIETLSAWIFVCPAAVEEALQSEFAPLEVGQVENERMLGYFEAAVEADPAHVGSNVALLLEAADAGRWLDVLAGARRFVAASRGHPYGLLIEGLALHRLRRSEEAAIAFERALSLLGSEVAARFGDASVVDVPQRGDDPWHALDPILLTEVNEREVEHLARASYAYLRFGGLDSDGAQVWLRYGRPLAIRALGNTDVRTEFWDFGSGPDLTFTRAGGSTLRQFTPEAATYLDELRGVFPQWYGTRARTLYSLPAQIAHYRGGEQGRGRVVVHLEVPGALRQEASDSVQVGVFVIDVRGERRLVEHRWIREMTATLQVDVDAMADEVVVEVYEPTTRQAAGRRFSAFPVDDQAPFGVLSDLLLVRPEGEPLARREVSTAERIEVHFEGYDLASDRAWRMRVELVSETSEVRLSVPARRAGQEDYRLEWPLGLAAGASVAREVLELDLTGVEPDRYTLSVVFEGADGARISKEIEELSVGSTRSELDGARPSLDWEFDESW